MVQESSSVTTSSHQRLVLLRQGWQQSLEEGSVMLSPILKTILAGEGVFVEHEFHTVHNTTIGRNTTNKERKKETSILFVRK
jgi:hypothetical protein